MIILEAVSSLTQTVVCIRSTCQERQLLERVMIWGLLPVQLRFNDLSYCGM
jgi:hypothetical protein